MPRFPVSIEKQAELEARMAALGIREEELCEEFVRGGGPGGQKINKTSVVVQLHHPPTGVRVRCQAGRSQAMNRFLARRMVVEAVAAARFQVESARTQAIAKIRRQKRKRSKRAKDKMLADKRHRSEIKQTRKKIET